MTGNPKLGDLASLSLPVPAPPKLVGLLEAEEAPWDWCAQTVPRAAELTRHLAQFVDYLNTRYAWSSDQTIPPCWPAHGALVEEPTTLMWSRWAAFTGPDATIEAAQTWHTYTLPAFLTRLGLWVGAQTLPDCRAGNHQPSRLTGRTAAGRTPKHPPRADRADASPSEPRR